MINNGVYAVLAEDSPLGSASSFKYLIAWVFDQIPSFPTLLERQLLGIFLASD